jgi:ketosteroid isomerase-like protein
LATQFGFAKARPGGHPPPSMKPRAAVVLATALALLAGCSETGPGLAKEEILAADKAFGAMSEKAGPRAAYLAYLASDAKQLSVLPQGADSVKAMFLQLPPTATLTWYPSYVDAAESGEFGYTWGRYTLTVPPARKGGQPLIQMGTYASIWKHQAMGGWKVVLYGAHPDGQK